MGCDHYFDECDCKPARTLIPGIDGPGELDSRDSRSVDAAAMTNRPVRAHRMRSREDRLADDLEEAVARYVGLNDCGPRPLAVAPRWAEAVDAMHAALTCESPTGPNFQVIGRLSAAIAGVMDL